MTEVRHYTGKRALDLLVLTIAAVPALMVGLLCALAVRLTSPGPVLFRQVRVGAGGVPFAVLKFRTMVNAPTGNPLFPDENCITRVGRLLRRASIDELPQLVNVARGEMSIVGPRPTLPYQVQRYTERQRVRLSVRPGVTGLAQVRGRNLLSWPERIEIDLEYVHRQSLWLDLRIMAASLAVVLGGGGVGGHPIDDPISSLGGPVG